MAAIPKIQTANVADFIGATRGFKTSSIVPNVEAHDLLVQTAQMVIIKAKIMFSVTDEENIFDKFARSITIAAGSGMVIRTVGYLPTPSDIEGTAIDIQDHTTKNYGEINMPFAKEYTTYQFLQSWQFNDFALKFQAINFKMLLDKNIQSNYMRKITQLAKIRSFEGARKVLVKTSDAKTGGYTLGDGTLTTALDAEVAGNLNLHLVSDILLSLSEERVDVLVKDSAGFYPTTPGYTETIKSVISPITGHSTLMIDQNMLAYLKRYDEDFLARYSTGFNADSIKYWGNSTTHRSLGSIWNIDDVVVVGVNSITRASVTGSAGNQKLTINHTNAAGTDLRVAWLFIDDKSEEEGRPLVNIKHAVQGRKLLFKKPGFHPDDSAEKVARITEVFVDNYGVQTPARVYAILVKPTASSNFDRTKVVETGTTKATYVLQAAISGLLPKPLTTTSQLEIEK